MKIEIYTQALCGFCTMAKRLLNKKGLAFDEIDVTGNAPLRASMSERAGGRTSTPQIFIGSTHIGGCDDLYAADKSGKLDTVLAQEASAAGA
ncbi:MAG: glutaredoxin 3 [Pseudomonadota bacterium]